jgi:hypothetical protein
VELTSTCNPPDLSSQEMQVSATQQYQTLLWSIGIYYTFCKLAYRMKASRFRENFGLYVSRDFETAILNMT